MPCVFVKVFLFLQQKLEKAVVAKLPKSTLKTNPAKQHLLHFVGKISHSSVQNTKKQQ